MNSWFAVKKLPTLAATSKSPLQRERLKAHIALAGLDDSDTIFMEQGFLIKLTYETCPITGLEINLDLRL